VKSEEWRKFKVVLTTWEISVMRKTGRRAGGDHRVINKKETKRGYLKSERGRKKDKKKRKGREMVGGHKDKLRRGRIEKGQVRNLRRHGSAR
jgi:hypothetical protein